MKLIAVSSSPYVKQTRKKVFKHGTQYHGTSASYSQNYTLIYRSGVKSVHAGVIHVIPHGRTESISPL